MLREEREEIASTNGNNQFTVYRRIMKSVAEATEELEDCGYDERKWIGITEV
ncbi:MAG: hypothetical protein ACLUSP_07475 [Christensenellales bacterium]